MPRYAHVGEYGDLAADLYASADARLEAASGGGVGPGMGRCALLHFAVEGHFGFEFAGAAATGEEVGEAAEEFEDGVHDALFSDRAKGDRPGYEAKSRFP